MASNNILANLTVVLGGDVSAFQKAMASAKKDMAGLVKYGESMKSIGKSMSMYVTGPLLAMGAAGVLAWDKQAKAVAQMENGIRSTGGAAKLTSKQLQDAASALQGKSLFGDEEILQKVSTQLLTFGNISGKVFLDTQQAALDLSAKLGTDLQGSAIMLGKALNDPVQGLSALRRVGISFTESQMAQVKALQESGDLIGAQTLILKELEVQYGGTAEAAAKTGLGPMVQLKNIIGDISEEFGKLILEFISPFIARLKSMAEGFQKLTPEAKKTIAVIAGIAMVIGPLVAIFGTILTMIPTMVAGFAMMKTATIALANGSLTLVKAYGMLAIKVVAIVAALGALVLIVKSIYDAWDGIAAYFSRLWAEVQLKFANALLGIIRTVNKFGSVIGVEFKGAEKALEDMGKSAVKHLSEEPYVSFTDAVGGIGDAMTNNLKSGMETVKGLFFQTGEAAENAGGSVVAATDKMAAGIGKVTAAVGALKSSLSGLSGKNNFNAETFKIGDDEKRTRIDAIKIPAHLELMPMDPESAAGAIAPIDAEMIAFSERLQETVRGGLVDSFVLLGETIGSAMSGGTGSMESFLNGFLGILASFLGQFGQMLVAAGIAKLNLDKLLVTPGAGPAAIVAGVALIALAGAAKKHFAKGPGGGSGGGGGSAPAPTSSGTSKGYGDGRVEFEISGDKLHGVLTRREYKVSRFGG